MAKVSKKELEILLNQAEKKPVTIRSKDESFVLVSESHFKNLKNQIITLKNKIKKNSNKIRNK